MNRRLSFGILFLLAGPAFADSPPPPNGPSAPELAGVLRSLLLNNLPEPLVQQKENWGKQGAVPMAMAPDEFGKFVREDVTKWAKLVKDTGMKVD